MRVVRFKTPKKDENGKVMLLKVIGFDPVFGKLVVENTLTGDREGLYMTTGAKCDGTGVNTGHWSRDENGNQIEVVSRYDYLDPPPSKLDHAPECFCIVCAKRREVAEAIGLVEDK